MHPEFVLVLYTGKYPITVIHLHITLESGIFDSLIISVSCMVYKPGEVLISLSTLVVLISFGDVL